MPEVNEVALAIHALRFEMAHQEESRLRLTLLEMEEYAGDEDIQSFIDLAEVQAQLKLSIDSLFPYGYLDYVGRAEEDEDDTEA